jgi:hypothetical protein
MQIRFISTRVHGVLDYVTGATLLLAPRLLGFEHCGVISAVPKAAGANILLTSLCTDYELGLIRAIPMRTHLQLDIGQGAFLAASPWLFGFQRFVRAPHVIVGLMEIALALTTRRTPSYKLPRGGRRRERMAAPSRSESMRTREREREQVLPE